MGAHVNKNSQLITFSTEFVCFVKVIAGDGSFGWGQTSIYNADISAQVFHRQIAHWALSADILGLFTPIERRDCKFPGSYPARAVAGLDTAQWDLEGRRQGKPVVELPGGKRGPLRAYAGSIKQDITPEDEAQRRLRGWAKQDFTAAK